MKLHNKVAVVTGGATGIGRAICMALAAEGAAVVVNYRASAAEAESVAAQIAVDGGRAAAIQADVSVDAEARRLMATTVNQFGGLDILVNNAGWTQRVEHANLDGLTDEILDRVLAVNVKGPLYCARAAIPYMQSAGVGSIVNITSVAALKGHGSSIIYGGSKAALSTITKSLARAFAPEIRVNAVAPGYVHTGFGSWPAATPDLVREKTPICRLVTPEDVAAVVRYLVTDGTTHTGEEFVVDGGRTALE